MSSLVHNVHSISHLSASCSSDDTSRMICRCSVSRKSGKATVSSNKIRTSGFVSSSFINPRTMDARMAICTFVLLPLIFVSSFGSVHGDSGNVHAEEWSQSNQRQEPKVAADGDKNLFSASSQVHSEGQRRYIQSKVPMMPSMALTSPGN